MHCPTKFIAAFLFPALALALADQVNPVNLMPESFLDGSVAMEAAPEGSPYPTMITAEIVVTLYGLPTGFAAGQDELKKFDDVVVTNFNKETENMGIELKVGEVKVVSQQIREVSERRKLRAGTKHHRALFSGATIYYSFSIFFCGKFCPFDNRDSNSRRSLTEIIDGGEAVQRRLTKNYADFVFEGLAGGDDIYKDLTCVMVDFGGVLEANEECSF